MFVSSTQCWKTGNDQTAESQQNTRNSSLLLVYVKIKDFLRSEIFLIYSFWNIRRKQYFKQNLVRWGKWCVKNTASDRSSLKQMQHETEDETQNLHGIMESYQTMRNVF